jgi:HSP20 family molecular chaperone IbpA
MKESPGSIDEKMKPDTLTVFIDQEPQIDESMITSGFIEWQPYYDLYVEQDEVVITLELAGIDMKDVIVYAHKSHVTITGARRRPKQFTPDCCTFHNSEIPYGRFYRRIDFPLPVVPAKQYHQVHNGLLTLCFPVIKERIIPIDDA